MKPYAIALCSAAALTMAGVYPLAVIVFIAAGILAGIEFWRYKKGV
ncbi:MAG: hypothetical protein E6276_01070 [Clostridiales bacterium]|nr:hypothetical protein [Clostridiales bacterium]